MSSTSGSTQLEGADANNEAIDGWAANCLGAGLLTTMAAMIKPQTSMHATNKPRRMIVSNFMSDSDSSG